MKKYSLATMLVSALALTACGESIRSGQVGVRVNEMGSKAGVQDQELGVGFYWSQMNSYIVKFPTTVRTEVWGNTDGAGGAPLTFTNKDQMITGAAISLQIRVDPSKVSEIVQRYRLGFEEMIDGPVRRRVQDALIQEGSKYTSEELMSGSGAKLLGEVLERIRAPLAEEGIVIENIALVGPFGLPESVVEQINQRVKRQQEAESERAQVEVIKAQAEQAIEEARGRAMAMEIEGRALAANPGVLRMREIEASTGQCPLGAQICVIGANLPVMERQ